MTEEPLKTEPTIPDEIKEKLIREAKNINSLDTTLSDGVMVATIHGTKSGISASNLGIEIKDNK
ncbi:MAG: hypothetical protein Q7T59_02865 [Candidatus Woesebacteria bacterium]|nr:hypothetical protein [Candidatus Woesebacteria bacterium]